MTTAIFSPPLSLFGSQTFVLFYQSQPNGKAELPYFANPPTDLQAPFGWWPQLAIANLVGEFNCQPRAKMGSSNLAAHATTLV